MPAISEPRQLVRGLPPQLKSSVGFLIFNIVWTFLAGEATGNVSQVDRVWTFLPPIYTAFYTFFPLLESAPLGIKAQGVQPRALIMTALQALWCLRLSYNTWRRGLFSVSEEDYRWPVFRAKVPKWFMTVFNLGFISGFQNVLLFMLGLPAYSASVNDVPLHWGDALLSGLVFLAIAGEFTADNQQWAYHNFKREGKVNHDDEWPGARLAFTQEDKERGFLTKGLWAYSRHPNVAFEQSVWLLMSLFPLLSNDHLAHNFIDFFAMLSPGLLLCILIGSSTIFTESITSPKYAGYVHYQDRVAMFWPVDTALKGLWLKFRGRKAVVDSFLWGDKWAGALEAERKSTKTIKNQ